MGHGASLDYPKLTKAGVALGLLLFLGGALAEALLHGRVPEWEATLFFDMEILGLLSFVLSPILFGVVLPLTE